MQATDDERQNCSESVGGYMSVYSIKSCVMSPCISTDWNIILVVVEEVR